MVDPVKQPVPGNDWTQWKVGKIAKVKLREVLSYNMLTEKEIEEFQKDGTDNLSKTTFGINFPLLTQERLSRSEPNSNAARYYKKTLHINGREYFLCSQWFDKSTNDNKTPLIRWIENHS